MAGIEKSKVRPVLYTYRGKRKATLNINNYHGPVLWNRRERGESRTDAEHIKGKYMH